MKTIDFSAKHDVLIRNRDGSLIPMDEPYFESEFVAPGTWKILSDGDFQYLVEGENEAIAIDTGYGAGNVRAYMQTLTSKPVRYAFNTHFHFDHTANNCYFDKIFMTAPTVDRATIPTPSFAGIEFPRDYPVEVVRAGQSYDLGNRLLEFFEMDFHSVGGLLLLDAKGRILFAGDEIKENGITLKGGLTVSDYARQLRKIAERRADFDVICTGGNGVIDASVFDKLLASAEWILAGHEGIPVDPNGERTFVVPEIHDPLGRKIYERRSPRPEDLNHNAGENVADMRILDKFGITFEYDCQFI